MSRPTPRHAARALLALALLAPAAPVSAGGPFQPPDGAGNPGGEDFTGYQVVGYVYGVRHSAAASLATTFRCINTGGADADDVAIQFYGDGSNPARSPGAVAIGGSLPVTDLDTLSSGSGTPDRGLARILAIDSVKKRNPAIVCQVHVENSTTGAPLTDLAVQTVGRAKKKR
jgi:hypothetical protein